MFDTNTRWPRQRCRRCGITVQLVRGRLGWAPYDLRPFVPHRCGDTFDYAIYGSSTMGQRILKAQRRSYSH